MENQPAVKQRVQKMISEIDSLVHERSKTARKVHREALQIALQYTLEPQEIDLLIRESVFARLFDDNEEKEKEILDECERRSNAINYRDGVAQVIIRRAMDANRDGDYKRLRKLSEQALARAKGDNEYKANALVLNAAATTMEGELQTSMSSLEKALAIYKRLDNRLLIANTYINLISLRRHLGDYENALEEGMKALEVLKPTRYFRLMAAANDNIGSCYAYWGKFTQAIRYYRQALPLYRKSKSSPDVIRTRNNMASMNLKLNRVKTAKRYLQQSLVELEKHPNEKLYTDTIANLASLYNEEGSYPEAIEYGLKALTIARKNTNLFDIPTILQTLCFSYLKTDETQQAIKYGKQSVALCEQMNLVAKLAGNLEILEICYAKLKDYENAWKVNKKLLELKDKIAVENDQKRMAEMEAKYRAEKNEIILKETQAKSRIVQKSLKEKEALLKEIHHRVKNNLQVISSLLDLQAMNLNDETALSALNEGQNRVKSIALIHQQLYQNDDFASIEVNRFVSDLYKQVSIVFLKPGQEVNFENNISTTFLDIDTAVPLGLMLNELFTNAFKYAFISSAAGKLIVDLKETEKGNYEMNISDNGPGLPADFDFKKAKSMGLRLVRRLAKQVHGGVEYRTEAGGVFAIRFRDGVGG